MEHYVTLFDGLFLPQGLALHRSLERYAGDYTLWVLCMDDTAHQVLAGLSLPRMRLLRMADLETEELLRVKAGRTRGEYCWTATPFAIRFVFEADERIRRVTYLDADIWFRRPPHVIFREFESSGRSVLITDHGYSPEHDQSATSGQYCVQFLVFAREGGERVRKWWEDRCIEWCFARMEDGKFGDQKYLDDWPERFEAETHVLADEGLALAPWNASRFPYGRSVFFHFHGLRIVSRQEVELGPYPLPEPVIKNVYLPYLKDVRAATALVESQGVAVRSQARSRGLLRSTRSLLYRVLVKSARSIAAKGYARAVLRY